MNRSAYGGWTLWPGGFEPFDPQPGWRDWRLLQLGTAGSLPRDVRYCDGRLSIQLPANLTTDAYEAALQGELGRFTVAEVTTTPRWLVAQSDAGRPVLVTSRYTLCDPNDFRAGAKRLDDLFVIDPTFHVALIAQMVLRARQRAIRLADGALRGA